MSKVNRIIATRSFENAVKQLKKKHESKTLKELKQTVLELANYNITKQKSNHPLKNSDGHIDLHLKGGKLVLLYKYEDDVLTVSLRLQDVVNHDQLMSYDTKKYKAPAREYDVDNISSSTILCSYDEFITWYDNLSDEEQWKVDDIADTNGIPFYEEASDDDLAWLHDVATIENHASPVKSYTDVEEDISRYDKDVDRYHMMDVKSVEDSDGFLTEYAMYEVRLSDGSIEYECYLGDRDLYGPWNGEGLDFESDRYDEAAEWWNDYNGFEVDDITSSTILDVNPEFRNNFEEAIDFFYESYPATVELTDEVDEDYDTLYKAYVKETGSLYQQTPGIVYIDINWDSGEILQALQETAEAIGIEQYPHNIESSELVEADAFSSLEDQYLSPPEYDDPIEHEDSEELVEVELNQMITVDVDGDYEWDDDTYVWASPDESNEEWRSEDGVYIDDKVGVVEHIDDLIIPNVPTRSGKYRVTGLAELIYDISGIQEYRTNYGPDDYDSDIDIDHAVVSFNFRKSEVQNLKITPVRR